MMKNPDGWNLTLIKDASGLGMNENQNNIILLKKKGQVKNMAARMTQGHVDVFGPYAK